MSIARVLIAYDGSSGADAIFEDLALAGLPERLEALVLSVADVWMPAHDAPQSVTAPALIAALHQIQARAEDELRAARATAEAAAARLAGLQPGWIVRGEAIADSPAWGVIQRAESWPADLVMVGSQGRSGLGRLVLGSVAARLVHELRCGVRVVRRAVAELAAAGLSATRYVVSGGATRGLLRRAQEWGATSIFVGARGLSRGQRLLLGSVSTAVAMRAPCSVEIVRAQ